MTYLISVFFVYTKLETVSLIKQLKGAFGKYYDYHRRDFASNKVDYLNAEDPILFSRHSWELEYQKKQEMRKGQPVHPKKKSRDMEL